MLEERRCDEDFFGWCLFYDDDYFDVDPHQNRNGTLAEARISRCLDMLYCILDKLRCLFCMLGLSAPLHSTASWGILGGGEKEKKGTHHQTTPLEGRCYHLFEKRIHVPSSISVLFISTSIGTKLHPLLVHLSQKNLELRWEQWF
jgi:hypothetical protein